MNLFRRRPRSKPDQLSPRDYADQARDAGDFSKAAELYQRHLEANPDDTDICIQAGHMMKEAGRFREAEQFYTIAAERLPQDSDLALQLGHFFKLLGDLDRGEQEYRRALTLRPGWETAERELDALLAWGWRGAYGAEPLPGLIDMDATRGSSRDQELIDALSSERVLAPELVATLPAGMMHLHKEEISVSRLGREERTHWGMMRTLRGIEAVRGFWTSSRRIREITIALNHNVIHRAEVRGPYILKFEIDKHRVSKYVFNEWIDFTNFRRGRYLLTIDGVFAGNEVTRYEEYILIADPFDPLKYPDSDGIIDPAALKDASGNRLDDRINSLPSVTRSVGRSFLRDEPRSILVLRTDQLGDMVASVPAMQKLKQLFPRARIIGLLTSGNADFAGTLGLFDEIIQVEFPDDPVNRRRVMSLGDQERLRRRLAVYNFDLAIDLADAGVSRPLLLLSGAPVMFGFRDREFPYLAAGYEGNSHDKLNRMECVGHSTQAVSLIARLEALVAPPPQPVRRLDLSPARLTQYGLSKSRRYILLHAGARIEFSRWPHFHRLAEIIIERTNLDVVLMGLEGEARNNLLPQLMANDRVKVIDGLLPFDDFDALISFCAAFVGNDSGPKHLASFRGVNVVGLHLVRNNWTEWAQEHSGVVMSRKVPCAGCNIFYDGEECGKEFVCLRGIEAEEVFGSIVKLIGVDRVPLDDG